MYNNNFDGTRVFQDGSGIKIGTFLNFYPLMSWLFLILNKLVNIRNIVIKITF